MVENEKMNGVEVVATPAADANETHANEATIGSNETTDTPAALGATRAIQAFDEALSTWVDEPTKLHASRLTHAWSCVVGLGTDEQIRDASLWWAAALFDARANAVVLLSSGEVVALESELVAGNVTRIVRVSIDGCLLTSMGERRQAWLATALARAKLPSCRNGVAPPPAVKRRRGALISPGLEHVRYRVYEALRPCRYSTELSNVLVAEWRESREG